MPNPSTTAAGPLSGLRVLDLTRILAGPTCTQLLGDYGADVIKVEKPIIGDAARGMGGKRGGFGGAGIMMNRSKRSIMLDMKAPEGMQILNDWDAMGMRALRPA